jgi:hypothetical protein
MHIIVDLIMDALQYKYDFMANFSLHNTKGVTTPSYASFPPSVFDGNNVVSPLHASHCHYLNLALSYSHKHYCYSHCSIPTPTSSHRRAAMTHRCVMATGPKLEIAMCTRNLTTRWVLPDCWHQLGHAPARASTPEVLNNLDCNKKHSGRWNRSKDRLGRCWAPRGRLPNTSWEDPSGRSTWKGVLELARPPRTPPNLARSHDE